MLATNRVLAPFVGPKSYEGSWGGGAGQGPRGMRQASQYEKKPSEPPAWNLAHHEVYRPTLSTNLHAVEPEPPMEQPMPGRALRGQHQVRGSPSYFEAKKASKHGGTVQKGAEVMSVRTLQWFPQTKQYYYGDPTPQRPYHQHYHLPNAESWLEVYQQPNNMGDSILGVRWGQRDNQDPEMMVVGWVPKFFRLDGYAMQMWRSKEDELLGRDYDSGYRPILFWDLRRLREVQLQFREGKKGPLINLYFPDGGVQFGAFSYPDAEMWRSACQHVILQVAMSDGGGDIHDNRGQKLLELMHRDTDTFSEENLSQLWDAYEQNRDGALNVQEIQHLMKEMVQQERQQAMSQIRNPRAQQEKVKELMELEQQMDEKFAVEVQQRFDVDHDGRVTKTEFMNQAPKIFKGFGKSGQY